MDGIYKAERGTAKVEAGGAKLASNSHLPSLCCLLLFILLSIFPMNLTFFFNFDSECIYLSSKNAKHQEKELLNISKI